MNWDDFDTWNEYVVDGEDYVSMNLWGKDHWSTLAYIETRAVDYYGALDNNHMRCNPRIHRTFAHDGSTGRYPTILNNGSKLENHDDWSCIEDMVKVGLLKLYWKTKYSDHAFGGDMAMVEFTEKGINLAHALRRHKIEGGTFANFNWERINER